MSFRNGNVNAMKGPYECGKKIASCRAFFFDHLLLLLFEHPLLLLRQTDCWHMAQKVLQRGVLVTLRISLLLGMQWVPANQIYSIPRPGERDPTLPEVHICLSRVSFHADSCANGHHKKQHHHEQMVPPTGTIMRRETTLPLNSPHHVHHPIHSSPPTPPPVQVCRLKHGRSKLRSLHAHNGCDFFLGGFECPSRHRSSRT